jgi:AraC-like DNA-binding protein
VAETREKARANLAFGLPVGDGDPVDRFIQSGMAVIKTDEGWPRSGVMPGARCCRIAPTDHRQARIRVMAQALDRKQAQDPRLLRRLLRAKDCMDAASHEAWPVKRLARVSGVSQAHFARAFKDAFGLPPHRYLLTRRIERAATLLRDTDLPVTEIAFVTGWNSLGAFGRTFRDITDEAPGELRARERAAPTVPGWAPACFVAAGRRPDLTIAVSEKRRREAEAKEETQEMEVLP